ncbi:MAG: MOSC domain-containing protein [Actinomycetes bacterium]
MTDPTRSPLRCDLGQYSLLDAAGTLRTVPARWTALTDGVDELPGGVVVALEELGAALGRAGGEGPDLRARAAVPHQRLTDLARSAGEDTLLLDVLGSSDPLADAVVVAEELLSAAARLVAGEHSSSGSGTLVGVHVSGGGVPKTPQEEAVVGPGGVVGDRQRARQHHGRPSQALSLWSADVIDALAAEGHPVGPGAAGENLTVRGLDWSTLRPGVRLAVGDDPALAVVAELTGWAEPCRTIAGCFADRRYSRIDHGHHPGWSRAYAAVLRGGTVRPGDPVRTLP